MGIVEVDFKGVGGEILFGWMFRARGVIMVFYIFGMFELRRDLVGLG